jgi:hypothetical protein
MTAAQRHIKGYALASPPRSPLAVPFTHNESGGHPALRQDMDRWCSEVDIWPDVRAEISDSALLKTFGAEGIGLFLAPAITETIVKRQYGVTPLGELEGISEKFYLFTAQRKIEQSCDCRNPRACAIHGRRIDSDCQIIRLTGWISKRIVDAA